MVENGGCQEGFHEGFEIPIKDSIAGWLAKDPANALNLCRGELLGSFGLPASSSGSRLLTEMLPHRESCTFRADSSTHRRALYGAPWQRA